MKAIFTILLLLVLLSRATEAAVQPTVRAALVTGSNSDSLRGLVDLVAVELHGNNSLQLLERQEIQAVLTEQKLAGTGLTDPTSAVAAGKLLSVDLFAVLDTQPAGIDLVVYDARSGCAVE